MKSSDFDFTAIIESNLLTHTNLNNIINLRGFLHNYTNEILISSSAML